MKKIDKYFLGAATLVSTFLYTLNLIIISSDFTFDHYLYTELIQLSSPYEYFLKLSHGKIYDLQPVRDLFLLIDIWGAKIFGFWFKIFTNTLLIFVLILQVIKLAKKFQLENKVVYCLLVLNPILLHIAGIDTAKKHILSAVFILLFLNQIYSQKRKDILALTYLALSLFSQPINIFLGLVPFLEGYRTGRATRKNLKFIVLCVGVGIINWVYYQSAFVELSEFQNIITLKL